MRYRKLGTITKTPGILLYRFDFDYALLKDDITEVFVIHKKKKKVLAQGSKKETPCDTC